MTKALVGYTGFVGSNLLSFYKFDYFFNSKNFSDALDMEFDELYFCGTPAVKWYANKFPEEDLKSIQNIINIIKTIKVNKFILISTIDVYENTNFQKNEDYNCNYMINNTYGKNRFILEDYVKNTFYNYHIIRLSALFGKGLKKNIIYDLLNNNQVNNINYNSQFQWYNLDWLKNDIDIIIKNNIKICNLFTEPVNTIDILNMFTYPFESYKNDAPITYDLNTKYSKEFESSIDGYIRTKEDVLDNIKIFIKEYYLDKSKLVISNICVKRISQFQFACILKLFGIKSVQISPTTLIKDWLYINDLKLNDFINNGVNVYSLQSIAYGLDHLNIFSETRNELLIHIKKVIDCAYHNNISILVFGCPKNRKILEFNQYKEDNHNIFITFFKELGEYCDNKNIKICIEPNSKIYNCNFLTKIKEVGEIVRKINNNNIKMMIDIGNVMMENDNINDIYQFSDIIYNVDISTEQMHPLVNLDKLHIQFNDILKNIHYDHNINLEMLINENSNEDELHVLRKSLQNFISVYATS